MIRVSIAIQQKDALIYHFVRCIRIVKSAHGKRIVKKERKRKMSKLIGYCEMKKTEGKICFVTDSGKAPAVGDKCEKVFLFGDVSKKITEQTVGREVNFLYGCGYNGKAYVADVTIK